MPIKKLITPSVGRCYTTKGLGFATMKIIGTKKDTTDETIYLLSGGNFKWEGTKGQFHKDFNGDTCNV